MSGQYMEKGYEIVSKFKSTLSPSVSEKLARSDDDMLAQMIAAAIADEVDGVVVKVDQLSRDLRSHMSKPELGM